MQWLAQHPKCKTAFVFGRERMGLSQGDIDLCQQQLYIPGNPDYDVLNLSQAVQIVSYECQQQLGQSQHSQPDDSAPMLSNEIEPLATQEEIQASFEHLEKSLSEIGFLRQKHPGEAMQRLKQFILKAQPNAKEVRMLRGICSAIDWQRQAEKNEQ